VLLRFVKKLESTHLKPFYLMLAKAILTCAVLCALGPLSFTLGSGEWLVPITLQSLVVITMPVLLGAFPGLLGIAAYLLAGILGLPVFADYNSGIDTFMSPSGGFLLGFLSTGWLAGWRYEQRANRHMGFMLRLFISCQLLLLLQGAVGLAVYGIEFSRIASVVYGLLPGLLAKSVIAALIVLLFSWLKQQRKPGVE
jgi:biotin transport system substrate-specific component